MHRMVRVMRCLAGAALVLFATAAVQPLTGQKPSAGEPEDRLAVISAILRFRLYWLEDATPVDVCSLYEQAGRPARFPAELPTELRNGLGLLNGVPAVTETPVCPAPAAAVPPARVVQFHSITVGDTLAQVRLLVRKGDQSHIEDYSVKPAFTPGQWDVADVRLWGRLYVVQPRSE